MFRTILVTLWLLGALFLIFFLGALYLAPPQVVVGDNASDCVTIERGEAYLTR